MTSMFDVMEATSVLGATTPGQDTIVGARMPPEWGVKNMRSFDDDYNDDGDDVDNDDDGGDDDDDVDEYHH